MGVYVTNGTQYISARDYIDEEGQHVDFVPAGREDATDFRQSQFAERVLEKVQLWYPDTEWRIMRNVPYPP